MSEKVQLDRVPASGPLILGSVYRRADLHARFGGSRYSGIVPGKQEPVVLLFHTEEPAQQFYKDGFDENDVYWYSGEGATGNMRWNSSNRAIRDHAELGLDLFFFERVQRKDGLWRFAQIFSYFSHKEEQRIDKEGNQRSAIVFGLLPVSLSPQDSDNTGTSSNIEALRAAAIAVVDPDRTNLTPAIRNVYFRSEAVRRYALCRAAGKCEACGSLAPFCDLSGTPFLEVHHIDRLADSGPDKIDRVAAICPNCHRRCHYSVDRIEFNSILRRKIATLEQDGSLPTGLVCNS